GESSPVVELEHIHAAVPIVRGLLAHRDDGAAVFCPGTAIACHADIAILLEHLHLSRILLERRREELADRTRHHHQHEPRSGGPEADAKRGYAGSANDDELERASQIAERD